MRLAPNGTRSLLLPIPLAPKKSGNKRWIMHIRSLNINVFGALSFMIQSHSSWTKIRILRACCFRHNNLALLQQYGSNAWRIHNYLLEADTKNAETMLENLREQTTSVN